mmetsp:Transcript_35785/g.143051  ORF Transcript_35785/g.143051 Transcript_35785/m.143051 type:complete len:103 (-) Transcript_35785:494-802(-)
MVARLSKRGAAKTQSGGDDLEHTNAARSPTSRAKQSASMHRVRPTARCQGDSALTPLPKPFIYAHSPSRRAENGVESMAAPLEFHRLAGVTAGVLQVLKDPS